MPRQSHPFDPVYASDFFGDLLHAVMEVTRPPTPKPAQTPKPTSKPTNTPKK